MVDLIVNDQQKRFEYSVDGYTAFIDYTLADNIYTLTHTEVPSELAGKGVGKQLVLAVLEHLKMSNFKLIPLCPFVIAFLRRNPEWRSLIAKGYIVK